MSNTNGLISTPGVFYTGAVDSNIYIRKGEEITLEDLTITDGAGNDAVLSIVNGNLQVASDNAVIFDPNGTGNATLTVSGSGGTLSMTSSNVLQLQGNSSILVYPSGVNQAGMAMTAPSAQVMNIAPPQVGFSQIFIQANKPMKALNGPGSGTLALGMEDAGCNCYVTCTSAGTFNLQFLPGGPGAGIQAGTLLNFILNRASLGSIAFIAGSTTLFTFDPTTAPANEALFLQFFTPDGTTFLLMRPFY